ncbi:bifunctional adenosylcobinamide kinase/adenosylcobinamide-phosphate guanylyltransferase [Bacillus sp. FJAT-27251]|uniref:bifunctional adenosylcobinamide kinase/adenosylcobinamide-phosphate guanylyltransferase n=1 Tax=Bacillus sp. FJAT-27251 TaxID=1684142 RepID=UPI000840AE21|nr:bifunctional adenosylcobinamide kinase/adenosylcobinamide-phosphate guanylyltransferase [Bacillus sp. FJAT-27251]
MHFVTGGAYNGKAKWIREHYRLNSAPHLWLSAYKNDVLPESLSHWNETHIVILEGIEQWIKAGAGSSEPEALLEEWTEILKVWLDWEKKNPQRKLIISGTDISKGIVPILEQDRKWRDITGWVYQRIMGLADEADLVWYGVSLKLKEKGQRG